MRAAERHRVPDSFVQTASLSKSSAKVAQQMMIAVLKARLAAERAQASEAGDRGSELGHFDVDLSDTKDFNFVQLDDELTLGATP